MNKKSKNTVACASCGCATLGINYAGCTACAIRHGYMKRLASKELAFEAVMYELWPSLRLLQYSGGGKSANLGCGACGGAWSQSPGGVLSGIGCPACARDANKAGPVDINWHPEYVKQARDWLLAKANTASHVRYNNGKDVGTVPYRWKGKSRHYAPQLLMRGTAVDVRPMSTLWTHFAQWRAKLKAWTKSQGEHAMLVVDTSGGIHRLPKNWTQLSPVQLEHPVLYAADPLLTVLAMDPGIANYAWSVVQTNRSGTVLRVLGSGKVVNTIRDLTYNVSGQTEAFVNEVETLIAHYDVNCIAVERFQSRGFGGTTIELVNNMIGLLMTYVVVRCPVVLTRMITPAQWKNTWNRTGSLDKFYTQVSCSVHQADSIGIGLYCLADWLAVPFDHILKTGLREVIRQTNATNTLKGLAL